MKKALLILCSLLISTQTYAQIKTGGGPDKEDSKFKEIDSRDKAMNDYAAHLIKKDAEWNNDEKKITERDLMQVYLKLSLYKGAKSSSVQCDEINRYFQRMHDVDSKKYAWQIARMDKIESHIAKKYNIPKEEAVKMLKFFETLSEKVE